MWADGGGLYAKIGTHPRLPTVLWFSGAIFVLFEIVYVIHAFWIADAR